MPRSAEATAASKHIAVAAPNTITSPWWNGAEINSGKNRRPVNVAILSAGSVFASPALDSRCSIGLLPRKAANNVLTGGRFASCVAAEAGTPFAVNPFVSVAGRLVAKPAIIKEKNTPMDNAIPEFWNVARMPDATPRCRGGTLPMIDDVFGAENIPCPTPLTISKAANTG